MENLENLIMYGSLLIALLAFAFAVWLYLWVKRQPCENQKIIKACGLIRAGARTFLRKEYAVLARFAGVAAVLIFVFLPAPIWKGNEWLNNVLMVVAYLFGTAFSAVSPARSASKSPPSPTDVPAKPRRRASSPPLWPVSAAAPSWAWLSSARAFWACPIVYLVTGDATTILGFSFGASSLALFAKAGGGIFTKTADISADLVGKVELGIPEDDPRNPAVIADNVGDNVGDVAGMGADLFDSNVASMAAALVMASALDATINSGKNVPMVFVFAALGLLASIVGVMAARIGKNGNPTKALNSSTYITTGVYIALTAAASYFLKFPWQIWGACVVGLLVGVIIGITTDYFTDDSKKPVHFVAHASATGPAFTILSGISYGLLSVLPAMIGIAISALVAYKLCAPLGGADPALSTQYALFGISMAAVGMLSIVGMIVSNDAYGPIVDNARGLAEMGDLGEDVLAITDELDSAGNTVKAVTKGFAIAAAGLTVIALLGAFMSEVNTAAIELNVPGIANFDIMNPLVFFGLLIGAAIPVVFSAMLMLGVDRNAQRMVAEIHRQFKEIVGLKEGVPGVEPEYDKCISIATDGALKELVPAGLVAIIATFVVGFIGGVQAIGGFLCGNIVSGLLFALFMSNSGGLWDNAKKYVESGHEGGKGSDAHKAAVVGDTVGDPFKDTAGPSINTQITVVSLVSSLMSTVFLTFNLANLIH